VNSYILLSLILLAIIIAIIIIPDVYSEDSKKAFVTRMYALIEEPPYYNSTENWIIVYSPDEIVVKDLTEKWYFGFAYWDITNHTSICNMFPELEIFNACGDEWIMIGNIKGDNCWDGNCISLLNHELKHLLCDCNWHENMTREKVNFKNLEMR